MFRECKSNKKQHQTELRLYLNLYIGFNSCLISLYLINYNYRKQSCLRILSQPQYIKQLFIPTTLSRFYLI